MKRALKLFILFLFWVVTAAAQTGKTGFEAVTAAAVKQQLAYLASDDMMGRDTPSAELDTCARYIADWFKAQGLEPAGANTDYFHRFNLTRNTLGSPNSCTLQRDGAEQLFEIKDDFVPISFTANRKVSAPVVFAGYGITAPEYDYDDYATIDAKGKIVFIFTHEPQENDTTSLFHTTRLSEHSKEEIKVMNAIKHGAVGMIMVTDPNNHRFRKPPNPWPSLLRNAPEDAVPLSFEEKMDNKIVAIRIGKKMAEAVIAPSGRTLSELQSAIDADLSNHSSDIPGITLTIETTLNYERLPTQNVVGQLRGYDPDLSGDYVVIGAHYDHVGALNDTTVFNGADDNASGTVGVMTLAKAFSTVKTRRSLLFCTWAGEEKGLFGSRYYVNSDPVIPLEKTVAYFNMDMIGRMDSTEVRISGITSGDRFRDIIDRANAEIGLQIIERKSVSRSDHAPFHDRGIPVLGFDTDFHPDYHQTTDTIEKCSPEGIVRVCRLLYLITREVADRDAAPVFQE
ncbi:M28 family peptidase [bacterium]|nr:M28 family peptidase [bacterium]